jgi:Tfp pilus assembly protein PilV
MKGQSLFEVILAVGIAAMVLIAIVSLSTLSVSNSSSSRDTSQANRYAQEAIEWYRSVRDSNWTAFKNYASSGGTTYCINDIVMSLPTPGNCPAGSFIAGTIFQRESTLSLVTTSTTDDTVELLVIVKWNDSRGAHTLPVTTRFTDWRSVVN